MRKMIFALFSFLAISSAHADTFSYPPQPASTGTVSSVSVVSANGIAGAVATATTTPAITLSTSVTGIVKGDGTAFSTAIAGDFPTLNQNTSGNAATVTTNANLTGPVTSVGNATSITANAVTTATINAGAVTEAKLTLANNTTANVTTGAHGFAPILPNDATRYLDGTGAYSTPAGAGGILPPFKDIGGCRPTAITGTSTTAQVVISACQSTDVTGAKQLSRLTAANWNVSNGNAANGYQGGATLPNSTTIHFYIITNSSNLLPAWFASSSLTPTLPTGYVGGFSRRIFSIPTTALGALTASIYVEVQGGALLAYLPAIAQDFVLTVGTTASSVPLSVPTGIKVQPRIRFNGGTNTACILLTSLDQADVAPNCTNVTTPGFSTYDANNVNLSMTQQLTTDTTGSIRARATGLATSLFIFTDAYIDFRHE